VQDQSALNPEFVRLLESLANGVVIADPAGTITFANHFLERMFSYERGELLGQSVETLLPADLRDLHARHRAQYNTSPETRLMGAGRDLLARRKDGSVFPVEVGLSPIATPQGTQVTAIVTDITKRKHAEQRSVLQREVALVISEAESIESVALNLLEAIGVTLGWRLGALWLVDAEAEVLRNIAFWRAPGVEAPTFERATRELSVRRGELLPGQIWQTGKPEWISDLTAINRFPRAEEASEAGLRSVFELPILVGTNTLGVLELFSRYIRPSDEALIDIAVAVASQIGQFMERKRSERAFGVLQQQYLQAQKMEAIGRLAGGIAHDFNNLLTIISVSADSLYDQLAGNDSLLQTIDEIARSTEQGASLVRQLMAFSRTQPRTTQATNLNEVVSSSQRMLGILAGEDIRVELDLHHGQCFVSVESSRLEQIVMNLVTNSRDAMPNGGLVKISTEVIDVDHEVASLYVGLKPGKHATLRIADTGHGIPADVQPHIFEPFFSTKEEGRGTGLGLATVYGIVRQHEGHIVCESAVDEGTTFTIFLPVADHEAAAPVKTIAKSNVRRGSETVLLVEDEPLLRQSVRRILEQNGYRVIVAPDGREALKVGDQSKQEFDLLVTDIAMPQMRGTELAARLLERHPQMRVLYMSGYSEEKVPTAESNFIPKPFRRDALIRKIREVLDSGA
jgi:PAS domain S-box-containing protein